MRKPGSTAIRALDYSFDMLQGHGLRAERKGLNYGGCSRGDYRLQCCRANSQEHASITVDKGSARALTMYQQRLITKNKQGDGENKNKQGPIPTTFNYLAKILSFTKKRSIFPPLVY